MRVNFSHGLGDCTYFAHHLPLYIKRGHEFTVECSRDKAIIFRASGAKVVHDNQSATQPTWNNGTGIERITPHSVWIANKPAVNLGVSPMPAIGTAAELWDELCSVRLDLRPYIADDDWKAVETFLAPLPRPVILLHTKGNTMQKSKSLEDETTLDLYRHLLDLTPGTLVLLDWDKRVPRLANYRVRHLTDDWEWAPVPRLMALFHQADLIMGIDSGPLHAARFTDTPVVGMFPSPLHHPALYCLPRARQVNVVTHEGCHEWNKKSRIAFNIIESPRNRLCASFLAKTAAKMLEGPRYLSAEQLGADVQLRQFIQEWEQGLPNALSGYVDRHQSFDRLAREISSRFTSPFVVETGCIRAPEDWRGAGYSTYLLGALLYRRGGELVSVDNNPKHIEFAAKATAEIPGIRFECANSVSYLQAIGRMIDVLLLDSLDTDAPGSADHALAEIQAALPFLHERSLVLFDDTAYKARKFHGKGEKAVPFLLESGWRIVYSGYQTLLDRSRP